MMSSTVQDLERFTHFAQQKLSESNLSLEECLALWRQVVERQELLDDVRQAEADLAAGLGEPMDEVFEQVRRKLGLLS